MYVCDHKCRRGVGPSTFKVKNPRLRILRSGPSTSQMESTVINHTPMITENSKTRAIATNFRLFLLDLAKSFGFATLATSPCAAAGNVQAVNLMSTGSQI